MSEMAKSKENSTGKELKGTAQDLRDPLPQKIYSMSDLKKCRVKEFGAKRVLDHVSDSIGLTAVLDAVFPYASDAILDLAKFFVATGDSAILFDTWQESTDNVRSAPLSPKKISELFDSITESDHLEFYANWADRVGAREYFALDCSPAMAYSKLIRDVDLDFIRYDDGNPPIHILALIDKNTRIPVFPLIRDCPIQRENFYISTLVRTSRLNFKDLSAVMGKGAGQNAKIDNLLNNHPKVNFLTTIPHASDFAKYQIEQVKKIIDLPDRKIIDLPERYIGSGSTRVTGVTRQDNWDQDHKIYIHIFHNNEVATDARIGMFWNLSYFRKHIILKNITWDKRNSLFKCLTVKKPKSKKEPIKVDYNLDLINTRLLRYGWMVAVSDYVDNADKAFEIISANYVIEKAFNSIVNLLDLKREGYFKEISTSNKVFISFISLILLSRINNVMIDNNLYEIMDMKKLFRIMENHNCIYLKGDKALSKPNEAQQIIYSAFGALVPWSQGD
ncbi:MAG: hypothetical protein LBO66_00730 [Deltaproteobacteria bacterium]|nr:hypothetical protein [Deltaproteobacteria bacterium]